MRQRLTSFIITVMLSVSPAVAGDWPQILGPNRNGIAVGESLAEQWPKSGPVISWQKPVGDGFAGVAIQGQQLILFHRQGNSEVVESRSVDTGDVVWSASKDCDYRCGLSSDSGPRCVPVITNDRVIVFGAAGALTCLDFKTGSEIWTRDTWEDFGAPEGYFGAGSTPLVVNDRVIVNVGGRDNAAVVAFALKDGATLWQSFSDTASYSSPVLTSVNGTEHVIAVTRLNTISLNPDNGDVRFQFPFGARGPTVNGACPVVLNDQVFVSASYRVGSTLANLASNPAPQSSGEDLLATQYATPVASKGVLFAVDGRQDVGDAQLCCIDPIKGKTLWRESGFSYGTLLRVNDQLLFLTCDGELIRFQADAERYREVSRHSVLQPSPSGYRLPALSNGRLFVRDDTTLKCLSVGP